MAELNSYNDQAQATGTDQAQTDYQNDGQGYD